MKIKTLVKATVLSAIVSSTLYASGTNKKLDKVTVTANKLEENLQNIPQSITVLDKTVLDERGITDVEGIINEIPNMTTNSDHGRMVNFRGLNASAFTNNNPVVLYIDGIPTTDRMDYNISMANVERVEVLRGPQGTLYGKDAIGGVINIITKQPTNNFEGNLKVEYGNYNTKLGIFNINGPIIKDKLFFGLNAQSNITDGWVTNKYNNDDKANKSTDNKYGGYLLYKATDRLSTKLTFSNYNSKKNWNKFLSGINSPLEDYKRSAAENVNYDVNTFENTKNNSQALSINYNFNNMELTSVTTHKKMDLKSDFDSDFGNRPMFAGLKQYNYTKNENWTEELRLSSNINNIKWVAGVYFDDGKRKQGPYGMQSPMGPTNYDAHSEEKSNTEALFGQLTFPILQNLDLTLGGRLQKITKDINLKTYVNKIGDPKNLIYSLKDKKTWNTFIPKIAIAYKMHENLTPYASISKGYMPGGHNFFGMSGTAEDNSFKPQTSIDYEIGIKGVTENSTFTASIFRMDIKDIHIYKQTGSLFLTDNAKKAHSQGVEFEFNYFPTNELEINSSIGFVDAKYDDYDAGNKKYNGQRIENTPKYTANLGIAYYHPSGYYGRINGNFAGSTSYFNSGSKKFVKIGSRAIADLKLGYKIADFDIYAYVKNLTNEEYITSYKDNGIGLATFNDPRTFGIGLKYDF